MRLWALAVVIVMNFVTLSESIAQDSDTHPFSTLYLYAERDGSVWFDLYLHPEPAKPELVSAALAAMVSETDAESVADYYDGFDEDEGASWSGYWIDALRSRDLMVTGTLELEPLRAILSELGVSTLAVEIYLPDAGVTQAVWSDESVVMEGDNDWNSTTLTLERSIPALEVASGFTPAALVLWYAPMLLCSLLLLGYARALWRAGLKRPLDEVGFACFACTRGSFYSILAYWLALLLISRTWNPLLPIEFGWGMVWAELTGVLLRDGVVMSVATVMSVCARMIVFPVYARFPEATWTRRDFVVQCLWACALAGLMLMCFGAMTYYLVESPARAVALAVFTGMVGAAVYWQLLHSMGLEFESLESGPLRDRVDALALAAGIPRLNGVYLLKMGKVPVLNAFAANNKRVLITDYLLRCLTRRELDAILAHEVCHLKKRHPERLRNILALNFVVLSYGSVALYLVGAAVLEQFIVLPQQATSLTAFVLVAMSGAVLAQYVRLRYARRFEREADDGALTLLGDAEAQIASLVKVTRMNHMPLVWGGTWRERMITHPSTRARVQRIAAQGQVSAERVEALLAGGGAEGDGDQGLDCVQGCTGSQRRRFTTEFKLNLIRINSYVYLVLPGLGATVAIALWTLGAPTLPGWTALPLGMMLALGLCVLFQNRAALRGHSQLARQMREEHAEALAGEAAHFVTFSPNTDALLYDGFHNWDVELLQFNEAGLHYRGDGTSFSLPWECVQKLDLVSRPNFIIPSLSIYFSWRDPEEPATTRTFLFRAADATSLLSMNSATRILYRGLMEWRERPADNRPASYGQRLPLPGKLDIKGQRVGDVCNGSMVLGVGVKYALCGFATAHAFGLPALAPFAGSAAGAALATGVAMMLFMAPLWRFGRTHQST
ncbi:MAG: M48 family metalloprotease [Candidatus Hydrogenedentes bacterium]|nr:M48 family metalloprotease [Candidatus Hydrogenedentota bacterium]